MIRNIEHTPVANDVVKITITYYNGDSVSFIATHTDLSKLSFFIDCMFMEINHRTQHDGY